jgi:hypothetical protein
MYSLDLLQSSGNMNLYDYNYDGHKGEIQRDMHEVRHRRGVGACPCCRCVCECVVVACCCCRVLS